MSEDYIMGKNPIIEALKAERDIHKILIAEGSLRGQMLADYSDGKGSPCTRTICTEEKT